MSLPTCPKCGCQLEVKLTYASGPKKATMTPPPPSESLTIVGDLLEQAESRSLNAWEQEFINNLRERYDQYGDRVKLSEKQIDQLERIAAGKGRS